MSSLISEDLVFCHIPKTAGQSIFYTLLEYFSENEIQYKEIKLHPSCEQVKTQYFYNFPSYKWDSATKFLVLREEEQRLLSYYSYGKKKLSSKKKPFPWENLDHFGKYCIGDIEIKDLPIEWTHARKPPRFYTGNLKKFKDEGWLALMFNNLQNEWESLKDFIGEDLGFLKSLNKSKGHPGTFSKPILKKIKERNLIRSL